MVFCSCSKKTTTSVKNSSSSSKSKSSRKTRFSFFGRKQPLAYVSTDLDDDDSPTYTPAELRRLKSTKQSKRYVDGLLYRNRKSGRQTLLNQDGVPMFSGFIDWFHRKMLRDKKEKGERYNREEEEEGDDADAGKRTMMLRARRIDPVKSGFMGKKAERDETTGCAAGTMVVAQWAGGRKPPLDNNKFVTPQKGSDGGGVAGTGSPMGGDNSFATASTTPLSSSSVSFQEDSSSSPTVNGNTQRLEETNVDVDVSEQGAWCGAFNSSISDEDLNVAPETMEKETMVEDYSGNVAAANEGSAWCNVFNSCSILPEEAGGSNLLDENRGQNDNTSSAKIRGIQNVEVVYSETDRKSSRSIFKKRFSMKKNKDSYKALQ